MITCRLIQLKPYLTGFQTCHENRLTGDSLLCGRGAACQVHLPDHRVGLLHATLSRLDDGSLQVEAASEQLISVNGFAERSARLTPGTVLLIGPYRLRVEDLDGDADLTLSVALTDLASDSVGPKAAVTLSDLGISKRRLGFWLAGFILLALLLLPLSSRLSPGWEAWQASQPWALTGWLSPGPLSPAHERFGKTCSTCHPAAFQAVTNSACSECHQHTAGHVGADSTYNAVFTPLRCTNCHWLHAGKAQAPPKQQNQCVACHRQIEPRLAEVADFDQHPAFHLTLPQGKKLLRVRQDEQSLPGEKNGLKFSHQVHLDVQGISSPDGRTVMTCPDCHKLEDSGGHFAPIGMEMTCQQSRCHKLRFEEPVGGIIAHGSEREVMNRVRQHYLATLAEAPQQVARQCKGLDQSATPARRLLDCADLLAGQFAASSLFLASGDSLQCVLCHQVTATEAADLPWKVAPVRINRDWQPKASFSHAKHSSVVCKQCHDKVNSKRSEDISFPSVQTCRDCHTGFDAQAGKISSPCQSCHRFHRVSTANWPPKRAKPENPEPKTSH